MGDPRLDPLFAELNRRRAVVSMHPTSPTCPCCQVLPLGYPRPMLEFMFETTRAVTNLLLTGTLDRFPDIRLIVPHSGAAVPVLADRVVGLSPTIGLANPVDPGRILYGSDWPFTPLPIVTRLARKMDSTALFDDATRRRVLHDNAPVLFPRLRG